MFKGHILAEVGITKYFGAIIIAISLSSIVDAQDGHIEQGYLLLKSQAYGEAIAYFNRAEDANGGSFDIHYYRARAYALLGDNGFAIADASLAIDFAPDNSQGYLLRAQLYNAINDRTHACEDVSMAASLGHETAQSLKDSYCNEERPVVESLATDWPDEEHWKVVRNSSAAGMSIMSLLMENETSKNWTDRGFIISFHRQVMKSLNEAKELAYLIVSDDAPLVSISEISRDAGAKYPWVIVAFEGSGSPINPESQVWYLVQGTSTLFAIIREVPQDWVPEEKLNEWLKFFESGTIVPAAAPVANR